ncbi:Survival protein SurA precursor (Peptidyl-prolyl cis-trans isomerase SurA) [hydrothermal vent metagenome]|uniref:peptidylprolyl isomerase n=1 Tax=hydrothermal vent metagenome TaxID=652676 RepID=A0A3B0W090_9ZZZZ
MINNKWTIIALTLISLTLPIQVSAVDKPTEAEKPTKSILAFVNDAPIYEEQLEPQVQAAIQKYKRFNKKALPDNLRQKMQAKVLEKFITAELIYQASKQEKFINIDQKIAEYTAKNPEYNMTKEEIKPQIQIDEYLQKYDLKNPQLPEKKLREFYEKNKNEFASKKERAHVEHIIVINDKDKIIQARKLIVDGKIFSDVAKEFSEDANAPQGGDLGFIEPKYMPEAFDKIAFSIPIGELSNIIKTEHGYHILKVFERKPKGTTPSFEEMEDFLKRGLTPQFKAEKVAAHIKKLREKAKIKILLSPTAQPSIKNNDLP